MDEEISHFAQFYSGFSDLAEAYYNYLSQETQHALRDWPLF